MARLLTILLFSIVFGSASAQNASIIGTWGLEGDPNLKMEFQSPNRCLHYFPGQPVEEFTYSIANTTPQCGTEVYIDQHTSYLTLTGSFGEELCFEINGITEKTLSITQLGRGGYMLFYRE